MWLFEQHARECVASGVSLKARRPVFPFRGHCETVMVWHPDLRQALHVEHLVVRDHLILMEQKGREG